MCMEGDYSNVETGSFLLALLGSRLLGFSSSGSHNLLGDSNRGVEGLLAVLLGGLDAAVLDAIPQKESGDGAHDFVLVDDVGNGDVLAELWYGADDFIVGSSVEEDGIIRFFFNLALGPFLNRR